MSANTPAPEVRLSLFGVTDVGMVRKNNEDTFLVVELASGQGGQTSDLASSTVTDRGTLIVVSILTARISDFVLDSRIGALDRTLGFVFGAARGLLLAVIGYLFFTALVGNEKMPVWAKDAKAKPMLEETGRSLISMLPQDVNADFIKNLLKKQKPEEGTEAPAEEPRSPAAPAPVAPAPARP